ncbi:MAG: SIR2 family protein [Caldilineaceae bacterium]
MATRPKPMISIPLELLEQIERGNLLLFIGEEIMQDVNGQVVIDQWSTTLATRCHANHPEEYSFAEAAQAYEDEMNRHALVQFVRDELARLGDEPQRVHRLIAELTPCNVLVTTCFDRCLERAFAEAGRPLDVIIGNVDVAFEEEQKPQLYKLRGSVERIESLVLTEEDYDRFFETQAGISVVLKAHLASKTILFIGYDLADSQFRNLYRRVIDLLDNYARRAYAFGTVPAQRVARWCRRHKIEVVETGVTDFLEALLIQLAARQQEAPRPAQRPRVQSAEHIATTALPERPYKLLAHYDPADAAIFFGREQEIQTLTSLIYAHRLVLLYAISGAGKTSLLLAGVAPHLERAAPHYATLYMRGRTDPAQAIRQTLRRRLPNTDLPPTGPLVDFLLAATMALGMPLVIFLDQFEEFFIQPAEPHARLNFIAELGDLYDARDVPVKLVMSLREDWLAAMSEFEARIPDLYRIKLRLLPLTRDQARQAITQPAQQVGLDYAPDLVERLLDDLAEVTGDGVQEQVRVMPPQLQLVCHALYERVRTQRRSRVILADYAAVGEAQGILARYVEEALQEHPGEEREVARAALMALVTAQETRTWADLSRISIRIRAEIATVERVLARLIRQRLVQRLDDNQTYELTHDVLAATIVSWISDEEQRLLKFQELLQRELEWQQIEDLPLSADKFQRINAVREHLRLTDVEAAFLLRAAVLYNEDVPYWLGQVHSPEVQIETLLALLKSGSVQARLHAATYLVNFPQETVGVALADTVLTDSDPAVRETAALSMGHMESRTGVDHLINTALAGADDEPVRAVRALAFIHDVDAARLPALARLLWRPIYRELVQIRFWRKWPQIRLVTAAGAVGGALSFSVGLTPLFILQYMAVFGNKVMYIDAPFLATLSALFGLLAGAGLAFGIGVGEVLWGEHTRTGKILGSALLGGLSAAIVLSPLALADARNFWAGTIGSGLFGLTIGCGVTAPAQFDPRLSVRLLGGAAGAALGMTLWMVFYHPEYLQSTLSIAVLLIAGGVLGLIMAFTIDWAEKRWPNVTRETDRTLDGKGVEDDSV